MNAKLNALLANVTVEYHKLQNQHWYVSGGDFFQAHAQLEELYDGLLPVIDDVAELILQLGGKPIASLAEVLNLATIREREDAHLLSKEAFLNVRTDFQTILDQVNGIKEAADAESNHLVSAKADELIASLSKTLWMLRQQAA
ncbi:MAG: DNA starvation/stationary phase protection protein [Parafannyhessea sp.]|jgi:starvation-inducible DNA-binding protein|uniref:Dps family protein n=1 Tax=Parafannyhessea TaxID=2847312 RepID=UPI003F07BC7D